MKFSRGFLSEGIWVLKQSWRWVAVIVLFYFLSQLAKTYNPKIASDLLSFKGFNLLSLSWIFLAYKAHSVVLQTTNTAGQHFSYSFGFLFRSFFLTFLCLLPLVPAYAILIAQYPIFWDILISGQKVKLHVPLGTISFSAGLLAALCCFALVPMLSTYLPAYVAQNHMGIKAAFDRGKRQWFYIIGCAAGLTLVNLAVFFFLIFIIKALLQEHLQSANTNINSRSDLETTLSWVSLWASIPIVIVSAYFAVTLPVIISRAYLRDPSIRLD